MNHIHTLIEHITLNWPFLTEAMSEKVVQALIQKFKEEAEDFNITISDDEIKKAITVFDTKFKQDPNVPEKDLSKYSLKQLLKIVSSKPGFEKEKVTIVPTPDMVYNEDGIVIYNGDVEGKCVRYGAGEKWCITKGSFGNYRFDPYRGYPNFYLVKNTNLPDSDPLSFVAIQARNNGRYVYTNRKNSPHESQEMDFDKLLDEVPYLNSINDVRSILKHIPISQAEINIEKRFKNGIKFKEWANDLDFEEKKLYISVRGSYIISKYSNNELFRDLSTDSFIVKVLPKYDKLAEWIFQNPWILGFDNLLKQIEIFKPEYQKSLLAKVNAPGHPINVTGKNILDKEFNFDFAKALVKTGKVPTDNNYNLYVTGDGRAIVNISYDRTGTYIDVITEEETYENIKLSKRTQKYLFDYPNISDIPLDSLARAIQINDLDNTAISGIIDKARTSNDTSKKIIKVGDTEVLFDTSGNRLKIYQVEGNSIIPADTNNENVTAAKNKFVEEAASNEEIQNNLISSIFNKSPLFNSEISSKILSNVPKSKLMRGVEGISTFGGNLYIFDIPSSFNFKAFRYSDETNKMEEIRFSYSPEVGLAYKQFLNDNDIKLDNSTIRNIFQRNEWRITYSNKIALASIPNLPYTEDSTYRLKVVDDKIYIINTANPAESFRISEKTGRILQARAPRTVAPRATPAQLGAGERVAAPLAGTGRRGRPAGGTNRPIEGNISDDLQTTLENSNLLNSFNQLPVNIRAKFFGDSTRGNLNTDRGVARRDNLLGDLGHVDYVRIVGPSTIYGIQLESGNVVASIVAQPGNSHWLLTQDGAFQLDSPANLVNALRQRNLTEIRDYIFNEYIESNPNGVNELKKHVEEIKNI